MYLAAGFSCEDNTLKVRITQSINDVFNGDWTEEAKQGDVLLCGIACFVKY